jgi:membrane-associated phospholipid phosphatase
VQPLPDPRVAGHTPLDLLTVGYLLVTTGILLFASRPIPHRPLLIAIHAAALLGIGLLRHAPRVAWRPAQLLREGYPLFALPLIYKEVEFLSRGLWGGYFDATVLRWDRVLFGGHPNAFLAAWFPSPILSEVLHLCYLAYALLTPILGLTLFFQKRLEAFRVFATTAMTTMYGCYLVFIFFPVRGPWYTFPHPEVEHFGIFPPLVYGMLERGAAVGAAFPSSHVALAVTVAILAHRFYRKLSLVLTVFALGIAVGTVYGGFHYAIDAVVGLLFGIASVLLSPRIHSTLLRRTRLAALRLRFPHLRFVRRGGRYRGELVRD